MCMHNDTKVLSTRGRGTGIVTRRKECERCGHRFNTMEVPETVIRDIGTKRFMAQVEARHRNMATAITRAARRKRIKDQLLEGIKPTAIAHAEGVTDTRIRQIRDELFGIKPKTIKELRTP